MKETLSESHWSDLATRLHIADPVRVFRTLDVHYQERGRRYHTAHHINECLGELGRARHPEASNPLVEYALWFHDAIYNTFSSKNEPRSADWAAHVLEKSGAPPASIELVRSLILATRHDERPTEVLHQLLVDVDLAILGADPERFREFELQIRSGSTHEFRERYERLARNNISWAMKQLSFGSATYRWTARF